MKIEIHLQLLLVVPTSAEVKRLSHIMELLENTQQKGGMYSYKLTTFQFSIQTPNGTKFDWKKSQLWATIQFSIQTPNGTKLIGRKVNYGPR